MARIPNTLTATAPAALTAAGGLVGGYGAARWSGKRQLGGAVLAVAGAGAAAQWHRRSGAPAAAALTGLYVVAFGGSHPLAKRIGAWPAVLAVTGVVAAASAATTLLVTRKS
ncbi:hypothetical protein [Kitasatospora purpeofusca]|uniref:hypothetical protein n=1 Tax=Kitasatospora purpeofusca TaxID=67352 RepID=UPI002A5ACF2D|nr:hypothetical protein [Kitasatospora purpeofusca]MDY0812951.1 hypothetical protein [Kitasatospora purpeofusca]